MNNTSTTDNSTIIPFELYSTTAEIIGYSVAYGILGLIALIGKYRLILFSALYICLYIYT
jgi:hypothetical protein